MPNKANKTQIFFILLPKNYSFELLSATTNAALFDSSKSPKLQTPELISTLPGTINGNNIN
jgi:hypothetical protein